MPVLGLSDQVGRDDQRVGAVVGDNGHLGRAGKNVDSDFAEQHALGFGDELVTRTHDDVGLASR